MKKKVIGAILALVMTVSLFPAAAFALLEEYSYPVTGGNIYCMDFGGYLKLMRSDAAITEADIPSSINGIPVQFFEQSALSGCKDLKSVTIPDSVTKIGAYAFMNCTSLTKMEFPDSVVSLGLRSFWGCTGLTEITFPKNSQCIDAYTFLGCTSLERITIPVTVNEIRIGAFSGCTGLMDVYYGGTEEEWNGINIDSTDNEPLFNAIIHFKGEEAAGDYVKGDVNADGFVNAKDKAILNRYLAGWEGYDKQILSMDAADINKDEKIDAKDKAIFNRYLAGWEGYDEYFE